MTVLTTQSSVAEFEPATSGFVVQITDHLAKTVLQKL